jgi:hypothetical protein
MFSIGERGEGASAEKYGMVVLDLGTRWRDCFPFAERGST